MYGFGRVIHFVLSKRHFDSYPTGGKRRIESTDQQGVSPILIVKRRGLYYVAGSNPPWSMCFEGVAEGHFFGEKTE